MFGVAGFWAFCVGAALIVLLPGPNSIFVLTTAAKQGVPTGYRAAWGVALGDSILMLASVGGVASVLRAHPDLFGVVKYGGAAYLAWLGLKLVVGGIAKLRGRAEVAEQIAESDQVAGRLPATRRGRALHALRPRRRSPFTTALVLCLLNPKSILFYIAFFVQFVDPASPHPIASFLVLAVTMQIFSLLYLTGLIFGGSHLAAAFRRRRRTAGAATAGVGLAFLGFGAALATASV